MAAACKKAGLDLAGAKNQQVYLPDKPVVPFCLQTRFGIDSADGRFLELYPAEISEQMQHDDRDRRFAGTM